MGEVRENQRNIAVVCYDYRKAYDIVHHDCSLRLYEWMGIVEKVRKVIEELMKRWRIHLEVKAGNTMMKSRWINIKKEFLQGYTFSSVGFCCTEMPVMMLLEETDGYKMRPPGNRMIKRTHSLFIDDLKTYQQNHQKLEMANEILVQASMDTGAIYAVKKCAEIVFKKGKMVQGEGLHILQERMKALDPKENEVYKFLGCEQAEEIDRKKVMEKVLREVEQRTNKLVAEGLYDKNMVKAINCRVIPVASYEMNVCNLTGKDLENLDRGIEKILRENYMHGRQSSDERLYLKRQLGRRGIKSFQDVYTETKVRVVCYDVCSENVWIREACKREVNLEGASIKKEAEKDLKKININVEFREGVWLEGEKREGEWKAIWKKLEID